MKIIKLMINKIFLELMIKFIKLMINKIFIKSYESYENYEKL
jgi:hypothetical protein